MDELLGLPDDALAALSAADTDDELEQGEDEAAHRACLTKQEPVEDGNVTHTHRLRMAGGTGGLAKDAFAMSNDGPVQVSTVLSVGASSTSGLGVFAERSFQTGEVVFSERPQVSAPAASSRQHCTWCLRAMLEAPRDLPHPSLWPTTPRQVACQGCGAAFCCVTCRNASAAAGHGRCCEPDGSSRVTTFEDCCRELVAMSPNPAQLISLCRLTFRMMTHILTAARAEADAGAPDPWGEALQLYAHLTTGDDGATGPVHHWCEATALRLCPLAQRALEMTEDESRHLAPEEIGKLLRAAAVNAVDIRPLSPFADYVHATRAIRRHDGGQLLRELAAHADTLRQTHASLTATCVTVDEVADAVYGVSGTALYRLQSKLNHSCDPCVRIVCAFADSTIDVVANRDIARGEELTSSFVGPGLGRAAQHRLLRDCYGVDPCRCSACVQVSSMALLRGAAA